MTTARQRAEYRAAMLARLDQIDEREREVSAMSEINGALLADLVERRQSAVERFGYARQAFPGMTWEEFAELDRKRERAGKRGRPMQGPFARADTPVARAARDVDRLTTLWRDVAGSRAEPPVPALEIAAERHGVGEDQIGERVRRPASRNPHRNRP